MSRDFSHTKPHYWFTDPSKIGPVLIVMLTLSAYSNTYLAPFIFDDLEAIRDNPNIRQLWPIWNALAGPQQTPVAGRPLVSLTLAVNYAVSGLSVWSYHVFNLTVHILNALLVFAILRRTFSLRRFTEPTQRDGSWLAGAVSLAWAVHPLNTEAVTYTIQRTELLVAFFFLLTLYATIRSTTSKWRSGWFACAIVSCLCGAGCKEVIAGAPLLVLTYDATFLAGSWRSALRERRVLYGGLLLTWTALAAILNTGPRSGSVGFGFSVGWWDYLKTQCSVILHYLYLAFWPHLLSIDYSDWPTSLPLVSILPQALTIVVLLGSSIWYLRKRSTLGYLGAWFFIVLAPTSSFIPIVTEPAAERRMYLPLIAIIALVFCCVHDLSQRSRLRQRRAFTLALAGLIISILVSVTYRRNFDYRSETAIWSDVLEKRPNNIDAHNSLGLALLTEGRLDEGLHHLLETIRLNPGHTKAHHNLGFAYSFLQHHTEAIQHYRTALQYDPHMPDTRYQLALEYLQIGDYNSAIKELEILKNLDPKLAQLLAAKLQK